MSELKLTGVPNVAFFGWMGGGKTTAAKLLTEFGYEHAPIFGTYPGGGRDIARKVWPDDPDVLTNREKLLAVGKLRDVDQEVWLNNYLRWIDQRFMRSMQQLPAPVLPPLANDDVRHMTEYQALKAAGWVMIRVNATEREIGEPEDLWLERDRQVRRARLQTSGKYQNEEQFDEPLEHYLDAYPGDYTIINDGSTTELADEVLDVVLRERRRS